MNRIIFYLLLLIINIAAFILIGISFLNGRSFGGEGADVMSETEMFLRHSLYGIIVSVIFSALAFILGYLYMTSVNITTSTLRRIFIGEFILILLVFVLTYGYIYLVV